MLKKICYSEGDSPVTNRSAGFHFLTHYFHREFIKPGLYKDCKYLKKKYKKEVREVDKTYCPPGSYIERAFLCIIREIIDCKNCGYASLYDNTIVKVQNEMSVNKIPDKLIKKIDGTLEQVVTRLRKMEINHEVKNIRCYDCGFCCDLFDYQGPMEKVPSVCAFAYDWTNVDG